MDELEQFFKDNYKTKKTIDNNKAQINKLLKYTKKNFKDSINDIEAIKYIAYDMTNSKGDYVLNTAYSSINCICTVITKYKETHPGIITDENMLAIQSINSDLHKKRKEANDLQPSKTDACLEDVYNLFDSFDEKSYEYLFLACNIFIPPRRITDWRVAIFVKELPDILDENVNYVVIGEDTVRLVLNVYKSHVRNVLGIWDKTLDNDNFVYLQYFNNNVRLDPKKLSDILKQSYIDNPRLYLFEEKNENEFNTFLNDIFSKSDVKFTQKCIRNIMIDELYKTNVNAGIKRALCHDMAQSSLETQLLYSKVVQPQNVIIEDKKQLALTKIEYYKKEIDKLKSFIEVYDTLN